MWHDPLTYAAIAATCTILHYKSYRLDSKRPLVAAVSGVLAVIVPLAARYWHEAAIPMHALLIGFVIAALTVMVNHTISARRATIARNSMKPNLISPSIANWLHTGNGRNSTPSTRSQHSLNGSESEQQKHA